MSENNLTETEQEADRNADEARAEQRPRYNEEDILRAIADRVADAAVDHLLNTAREEGEAVLIHRELASGYESTGADAQEIRELIRANYHQNEAILNMLSAVVIRMDQL